MESSPVSQEMMGAALISSPKPHLLLLGAAVRSIGVVAATLAFYALIPIRPDTALMISVFAVVGLVAICVVFGRQVVRVAHHPKPVLAAAESLSLVFGMFVALFALVYASLSAADSQAFSQPVGKVAGIYLSVTILSTVGFGDIAAASDAARVFVTVQMVSDLVLIGTAVKLLGSSARQAAQAQLSAASGESRPAEGGTRSGRHHPTGDQGTSGPATSASSAAGQQPGDPSAPEPRRDR
jgi:hypothetical protein